MVKTSDNTNAGAEKRSRKRLSKKTKIILIVAGVILLAAGGAASYVLYNKHTAKVVAQQSLDAVENDEILSLRDFADKDRAVEYLTKYRQGDKTGAYDLYATVLQENKGKVTEYAILVDCHRISIYAEDGKTALLATERLYELYPDIDHTVMLASAYGVAGNYDKQIEYLEKASTLNPPEEIKSAIEKDLSNARESKQQ